MNERRLLKLSSKERYALFSAFVVFCLLLLAIAGYLNYKSLAASRQLLEVSVKSQLISIASAAEQIIDDETFNGYNAPENINNGAFRTLLAELRLLATHSGAKYIYAIKVIDDQPMIVIDTDPHAVFFLPYELSDVHKQAFKGRNSAGISNVVDEYGSFSTGAVPIRFGGKIIGIVAVDVEDALIKQSEEASRRHFILMMSVLGGMLLLMSVLVYFLLGRVKRIQDQLKHMANYDKLTNLPNRQYLLDYLDEITGGKAKMQPFALFFIDLDNFKRVNDNAGHDAGDSLLKNIGHYLEDAQQNNRVFRPGPGMLNIAARIGGDEFLLVVPGIENKQQAAEFAQTLLEGFRTQQIDRYIDKYEVGLSIGVSLYPYHSDNYNVLIKYADIAMYHAKFGGKNCYRVYDDDMKSKEEK